jgi:RNA polymerase sigma-70 factor (ECF subfamily)
MMLPDLEAGLRALRADHRTALLLRVEGERSYTDIAYVMGVAVGTAKSYVHRARRQLADHLRDAGWGGATDTSGPRST